MMSAWRIQFEIVGVTGGAVLRRAAIVTTLLVWMALPGIAQLPATTQPATPIVREAEDGPVHLRVEVDRSTVGAGETAEMRVDVRAERGVDIEWPTVGAVWGGFLIKPESGGTATSNHAGEAESGRSEHPDVPDGGENVAPVVTADEDEIHVVMTRRYRLEPALPGEQEIPAFEVSYEDGREKADGSRNVVRGQVRTAPFTIQVAATLADVKGTVGLSSPWRLGPWLWIAGVVAALALVGLCARWWRGRARRPIPGRSAAVEEPIVPAHIWALAELDRLMRENLIGRGMYREFYYALNGILRQYIERRFGLMAGEQTSEEFIEALQTSPMLEESHNDVLRQFVSACDPVKYARHMPAPADCDWVRQAATDFIHGTAEVVSATGASNGARISSGMSGTGSHGGRSPPYAGLVGDAHPTRAHHDVSSSDEFRKGTP